MRLSSEKNQPFALRAAIVLLSSFLLVFEASAQLRRGNATGERRSFSHEGRDRAFRIHVPGSYDPDKPIPLVFVFHGGGGNADQASSLGWTPLAEKHGFLVVYPEGLEKHWNDGRDSKKFAQHDAEIDDVAFVLALLEQIKKEFHVDSRRIYATGNSNGGFFSHRLAIDASETFTAAGVVIATLAKPYQASFQPSDPVSMLFMNGTDDPFVPYDGGPVTPNLIPGLVRSANHDFGRGECASTEQAVQLWLERNGLEKVEPVLEKLPDHDPDDGCTVEKTRWSGGVDDAEVILYRIEGGGHNSPGRPQYLPARIIGKTCGDLNGIEAVWEFFSRHQKPHGGES